MQEFDSITLFFYKINHLKAYLERINSQIIYPRPKPSNEYAVMIKNTKLALFFFLKKLITINLYSDNVSF